MKKPKTESSPVNATIIKKPRRVICKYCRSDRIRKYGFVEGVQRYFCNDCRRKFSPNDQLFRMKTPAGQVAMALESYYLGKSVNQIRDQLNARYSYYPSSKTVYSWIIKYTGAAIRQFKDYYLEVGERWALVETEICIVGKKYRCRDIVDNETGYLLATGLSFENDTQDILPLLAKARERAGKSPRFIAAVRWREYAPFVRTVFGEGSFQPRTGPYKAPESRWIENTPVALECRNRTLKRFKNWRTAVQFLAGSCVYYNYLRPAGSGADRTPAEAANVHYNVRSWLDVTRMTDADIQVLEAPLGSAQGPVAAR